MWQSFAKIGSGWDVEKSVDGKEEITRLKYNSLPLSIKRHAGDCNVLGLWFIYSSSCYSFVVIFVNR